jgi:hypothetical protein
MPQSMAYQNRKSFAFFGRYLDVAKNKCTLKEHLDYKTIHTEEMPLTNFIPTAAMTILYKKTHTTGNCQHQRCTSTVGTFLWRAGYCQEEILLALLNGRGCSRNGAERLNRY